jgi:type IV pilus assembly protein PilB
VDELLNAAVLREASDIHLEPEESRVRVRLRVHGRLEEHQTISQETFAGVLGRIKVLAQLDIAEKRLPQDGQIHYTTPATGRRFTLRVATLPAKFGERVTLRVLGLHASSLTLEDLGMSAGDLAIFSDALARPNGMVLITGPTGSGKTSTMYAALRHLLQREAAAPPNIITIEDPVEYDLPGITQIEVDDQRLTHARALRSVLRHDPDVILVGEIRDRETADIALRAAMTGHLVISTLHTRSAPAAITRLLDLGVDPYLIAATVHLALAQRLVRRLCRHCRQPAPLTAREAFALGDPSLATQPAWQAAGCKYCAGRGYTGRLAVFEFFTVDRAAAELVAVGSTEATFHDLQRKRGETTLRSDGVAKVLAGVAAARDVARVLALPSEGE